jgi:hypothetical protein
MSSSPAPPPPAGRRLAWTKIAIALAATAVLVWRASRYWPFLADDALISLRYARRFVAGQGLTWTDGERVEGYSNLLWILLCSGLHALGMDLVTAARALGLLGHVAVICAVVRTATLRSLAQAPLLLLAVVAFCVAGPIAAWTIGGLEHPLLVGLLAWAVAQTLRSLDGGPTARDLVVPGVLLGLVCLTRPDGIVLGAGLCVGLVVACGPSPRSVAAAAVLAAPAMGALLGQLVFRRLYYDDWIPNTAYAKVAFTIPRFEAGLDYVASALRPLLGIFAPAAVAVIAAIRGGAARRRRVIVIAVPLVLWLGYIAVIGGDFFPARRHLVPAIALAVLLIVESIAWLASLGRAPLIAASLIMAGFLVDLAVMQRRDRENSRARHERWEWDGAELGVFLKQAFGQRQPLAAIDPAGCIPYFSDLPSLDMMGLNDRYLARHRPPDFGTGALGHELGDGRYVLSRRPDLVVFCDATGTAAGCFRSGLEMTADPEFHAQYRLITFETARVPAVRALVWVRLDGRIGLERTPAEVRIPGWWFTGPRTVARLVAGRVVADMPADQIAELSELPVEPGAWQVRIEAEGGEVGIRAGAAGPGDAREGRGTLELSHRGGNLGIALHTVATGARIAAVVLTRHPD